jgi:hypothetical protein
MRDIIEQFHQMADGSQGGLAEVFGRMWSVPAYVRYLRDKDNHG